MILKIKHLPYKSNADIQLDGRELRTENFRKGPKKIRFRDKYIESHENMFFIYLFRSEHYQKFFLMAKNSTINFKIKNSLKDTCESYISF